MAIQAHTKRAQEGYRTQRTVHVQSQARNRELKSASTAGTFNSNKNFNPIANIQLSAIFLAKVTKSSTRTQIPDLISTIKPTEPNVSIKSDRKSLTVLHRRSASLTTNHPQLTKDKSSGSVDSKLRKAGNFHDVKPRYLEPKRQPDALKVRALSSSGSSRTSSPIASARIKYGTGNQLNKKPMSDSISMSRDSLASPAKRRGEKFQANDRHDIHQADHERLSADSLGGSLHSSVITNKTISQESLVKPDAKHKTTQNHPKVNPRPLNSKHLPQSIIGKCAQLKVCGNLISQHSSTVNSSTPSSMTVKSYLSSSNSINSPRDTHLKGRLTTPAAQHPMKRASEPKPATKSFLSARSRQILAQKKSLSHSDSSKSVPGVIKETNATNAVNKSSSTSNILSRKSKNIPLSLLRPIKLTTSHEQPLSLPPENFLLKDNNQSGSHSLMNPTKSSAMKMVNQLNKLNRDKDATKQKTKTIRSNYVHDDGHDSNTDHENDFLIDTRCSDASDTVSVPPPIPVESKLERSSTFCKDRSDINNTNID